MNELSQQLFDFAPEQRPPIVLSNGYGLNSLAALVGLRRLGIIPDLIIHADVGSEKADTKAYKPIFDDYLARDAADSAAPHPRPGGEAR